jgi:diacylglycerol kinase family enzyme
MRVHIIINDRAGTVVGTEPDAFAERTAVAFAAAGHTVSASVAKPAQLPRELERVRDEEPDALIVGGGDGTVRAAATALLGTRIALGVLPLGTINRLARDLQIPIDGQMAAETLATGRVQAIDVAEVNGRLFLCNAILGPTTRVSAVRQQLRGKPLGERIRGYLGAAKDLLRARHRIGVRIDDGIGTLDLRVLSLVVTNNTYADEPTLTMRRPNLDDGVLGVYASQHTTGWGMVVGVLRALFGLLATDRDVIQIAAPSVVVGVPAQASISLSIDGELERLPTPLVFSLRPKALNVLVPAGVD